MLKLVIQDLEHGRSETRFGSDQDLVRYLGQRCRVATRGLTLKELVEAINAAEQYRISYDVYQEPAESNLLPADYVTHSQDDDPWVREGDKKDE